MPWIVTALMALWVLSALRSPTSKAEFDSVGFGRLPAVLNGRLQPLDSVARNALLVMRGKQAVALDDRTMLPAREWLLEVAFKPEVADTRKVFRIDHPDLRGLLKLPVDGPNYFAFDQVKGSLEEIDNQARRASRVESQHRNTYEKAVLKLHYGLTLYQRLKNSFRPEQSDDFRTELAAFQDALPAGLAAWRLRQDNKEYNQADLERMARFLQGYDRVANAAYPLLVPPLEPQANREGWSNIGASLIDTLHSGRIHPAVTAYAAMATTYRQAQPTQFNEALTDYRSWLTQAGYTPELGKGRREFLFHQWSPFYQSTALYVIVFILGCATWFVTAPALGRTAFWLLVLAFLVHTAGIVFRMVLEGRPPVTNLYSSAVFVGWGAVLLGIFLERIYRDGIGLVMASTLGFLTQIVAHNLSLDGDTMEMLRAVLDTNFWLATHVITITLGYSAMFVAGFLAIMYVIRGVFTRHLGAATRQALARMVYGVVCFATLFSFIGTILGGIWADQSWGRFWGWDPKENGALLIVLWCAIILHARWGGLVRERGLMNLTIFGNIITSFSWFGVNMLGVGLHSYGFMDSAMLWLGLFVLSQLAFIGLGLLPERLWASLRAGAPAPATAAGRARTAPRPA